MERRGFIKNVAVGGAAGFLLPTLAANAQPATGGSNGRRRFVLTQVHNLIAPEGSAGTANLWVPLPGDAGFQQVRKLSFEGNYKDAYVTSGNAYGARTLFATWPDAKNQPKLTLTLEVETLDWEPERNGLLKDYRVPSAIRYPKEVEPFLGATAHIRVDGIVRQTADKIVGGEKNPLAKARLVYEWVSANMTRDNSVVGCGTGDVKAILESGKLTGKCTDINSVFVALARAAGIPARELFGIRLGRSVKLGRYTKTALGSADEKGSANESGGQHCRAMFYLAGFGWVPCDPADVTKMRLTEKKEHGDPDVQAVNDYLFGNWEMNWVGFNCGRDFDLYPAPEQTPINNFGYPYAEVDGDPLNFYDPKVFSYDYTSQET
ncbi:MAG: transglutaminase domain-containing protein [Acidobacteriota bacterium]|jgi:transglutaminase-like putative cysteine protease|nr:transglutaminase domain-containing protein [Acidobacteriota bacterium]